MGLRYAIVTEVTGNVVISGMGLPPMPVCPWEVRLVALVAYVAGAGRVTGILGANSVVLLGCWRRLKRDPVATALNPFTDRISHCCQCRVSKSPRRVDAIAAVVFKRRP